MPLTTQDWENIWDKAQSDITDFGDIYEGEAAYPGKALNLLFKYAAYSKSLMALGWHKNRVGASLHFFSKRWGDQYTTQVADAIDNFYHVDGTYALQNKYRKSTGYQTLRFTHGGSDSALWKIKKSND